MKNWFLLSPMWFIGMRFRDGGRGVLPVEPSCWLNVPIALKQSFLHSFYHDYGHISACKGPELSFNFISANTFLFPHWSIEKYSLRYQIIFNIIQYSLGEYVTQKIHLTIEKSISF